MEAIFRVDGAHVVTSPDAAGPWDPNMQHGGAQASLVVWAAERIPAAVPMQVARVTIDLMRPVPVAPLTLETEVLREGRKIQICAVRLFANGTLTVGATVLKIKKQAQPLPGCHRAAARCRSTRAVADRTAKQPLLLGHDDPRRARPVRRTGTGSDLVSRRSAAD